MPAFTILVDAKNLVNRVAGPSTAYSEGQTYPTFLAKLLKKAVS